jgi:hypothetical protein
MTNLNMNEISTFVEENIGDFHTARLESLAKLKLKKVLQRKKPLSLQS